MQHHKSRSPPPGAILGVEPTFTSAVGSLRYTFSGSLRTSFLPATTITTTTTTAENVVFL